MRIKYTDCFYSYGYNITFQIKFNKVKPSEGSNENIQDPDPSSESRQATGQVCAPWP